MQQGRQEAMSEMSGVMRVLIAAGRISETEIVKPAARSDLFWISHFLQNCRYCVILLPAKESS